MAAVVVFPRFSTSWSNSVRCFHFSTLLSQIRILQRPICTASDYNPLFEQDGLPKFKKIDSSHVVPAMETLTCEFTDKFQNFETKIESKLILNI